MVDLEVLESSSGDADGDIQIALARLYILEAKILEKKNTHPTKFQYRDGKSE
jgi:hypothetical protein